MLDMILLQSTIAETISDSASMVNAAMMAGDGVARMNLLDMAMKGGWIMIVLAALSILCLYIFFERLGKFKKAVNKDVHFMDRICDYVKNGEIKSAVNFCQALDSPCSRIVEKGVSLVGRSKADIQAGMENAANIEIARLEKGLSGISTIASAAPMIGFLGTVIGMVRAFWEMSNAGNNIDVSLLSGGIYEAMITTVGGLIVGIIALFAYNYLVSRVDGITNQMESFILDFVEKTGE